MTIESALARPFTRRNAALSMLALALPGVALAQDPTPESSAEPDATIATGGNRFEHMLAPVTINGRGPFNFLMDTGANVSCVSNQLASKLNLTRVDPVRVHTVVGARQRPRVMIDHLQVGARSRRNVKAPSLPITGATIDGILGVDWLKGQRLVLGFKAQNLEITRSRIDSAMQGRVVVPARRRMGQLTIIDADLNGKRISAMVDSGSQVTICNGPLRELVRQAESRRGQFQTPQRVQLQSLAGETFVGETIFLPFLRLGGLHLGNVQAIHADMHVFDIWDLKTTPAIVLGMDLLTQFDTVALDFGRSSVTFDIA
jgi:predicted aspartyl protease